MSQQQYRPRQSCFRSLLSIELAANQSDIAAADACCLDQPGMKAHWAKRFGRAEDGSTTIEFALCIIPFLMITIGLIELMLMFFTVAAIEGAMDQATREVRTGQIQSAGDPETAFREALCDHTITVRCADIRFEMVAGDTVADVNAAAPFWEGEDEGNGVVEIGVSGSFVIARAAYDFQFITPLIGTLMGADLNNEVPIRATAVVRNEPF